MNTNAYGVFSKPPYEAKVLEELDLLKRRVEMSSSESKMPLKLRRNLNLKIDNKSGRAEPRIDHMIDNSPNQIEPHRNKVDEFWTNPSYGNFANQHFEFSPTLRSNESNGFHNINNQRTSSRLSAANEILFGRTNLNQSPNASSDLFAVDRNSNFESASGSAERSLYENKFDSSARFNSILAYQEKFVSFGLYFLNEFINLACHTSDLKTHNLSFFLTIFNL